MTEPSPDSGPARRSGPAVPVGGGVPIDPETGRRYGYLPPKAANRKLIIRAELGLPWLLAALGFGLVIAAAGVAYLVLRPSTPGAPYVDRGPLSRYADGDVTSFPDASGWLDRRAGLVAIGEPVSFCRSDGGWVDAETARYDAAGRRVGGGEGLLLLPVRAAGGRVFVDPTGGRRAVGDGDPLGACLVPQPAGSPAPPDGL